MVFSTDPSFSAQSVATTSPPTVTSTSRVSRSSTWYVALDQVPHGVRQRLGLGLGEEADPAEVDADQRHAARPGQLGRPQERAVAAEHQHDLGAERGGLVGLVGRHRADVGDAEVGRLVGEHPHLDAGLDQPRLHLPGAVHHVGPAGVR